VSDKIHAPWSPEVAVNLNAFQRRGHFHPFTCGLDSDHGSLIARVGGGWVCPNDECDYTQDWAHSFMADRYPDRDGERGEITVTTDGPWWQWIKYSWEARGRWVPTEPVRTVTKT